MAHEIECRFEYRYEYAEDLRLFFKCMGMWIVYAIKCRFEFRNEYHASRTFVWFYVLAYRWSMKSNVDLNIEKNFMLAADSRFYACAKQWCMQSNVDLNIEMNITLAADSHFFMYVH